MFWLVSRVEKTLPNAQLTAALLFLLFRHRSSFPTFWPGCFFTQCVRTPPLQPFGPTAARTLSSAALWGGQAGQPSWLWRSGSAQPSPLRPSAAHSAADFPSPLQPFWTRSCVRPLLCGAARWEGRPAELALAQRLSPTFPVPPERHTQRLSPPPFPPPKLSGLRPRAPSPLRPCGAGRQASRAGPCVAAQPCLPHATWVTLRCFWSRV